MAIKKESISFDKLIQDADKLIRQAQHGEAREILTQINLSKVSREQAFSIADLARRVNTPRIIVNLLKPIIFQEIPGAPPPSSREKALYATGLSRLGVFHEAQNLFRTIDIEEAPEALLYLGQHYMIQWDDLSAIPKFRKFIRRSDITDYLRLVGKINLASCLVSEMNWRESDALLGEIRQDINASLLDPQKAVSNRESFFLLYANSLELSAQSAIGRKEYQESLDLIKEGERFLKGTRSRYELMLKKWRVIAELMLNPAHDEFLQRLIHLKEEAKASKNWETYRDFEFYQALLLQDEHLFLRLYFGTPYTSFRRRIKNHYSLKSSIPKFYDWDVNGQTPADPGSNRIFDLSKGCMLGGTTPLTSLPLLLNLLQSLCRDFYRPVAMGTLISTLYPDEHYNPVSSPEKAIRAVKRLRKWFLENDLPLKIEMDNYHFRLVATAPFAIRVKSHTDSITKNDSILESLRTQFPTQVFTSKDISESLELSLESSRDFLKWAVKVKKIKQVAAGRSTRYRLK